MADSNKIGVYCDGSQFKESQLFNEDPCALQIRIYYDDVEICNALCSKTKRHKLGISLYTCLHLYMAILFCFTIGLFYFTLGNIDPKYRSSLHSIQLLCVVKTNVITKFGINEVLKPFVQDMLELESIVMKVKYEYFTCIQFLCIEQIYRINIRLIQTK